MEEIDDLFYNAQTTGENYLNAASNYIFTSKTFPHKFESCIRLAELMAKDFDTMMKHKTEDSLCTSLERIATALESIASNKT